jgi:hypothetical protein
MIVEHPTSILLLLLTVLPVTSASEGQGSTLHASAADIDEITCPPKGSALSMSVLEGGNMLLEAWKDAYTANYCPDFRMTFEDDTYDTAASRVCANSLQFSAVDLASMAGPFFPPQAETILGWDYICKRSKSARKAILVSFEYANM